MSRTVSMRWLVAIVAGVVVGMFALTGTAAAPPAASPVRILDATNAGQIAKVDANGNLQVGGTVGIDTSTTVATTSLDDPGRRAFQFSDQFDFTGVTGVLNIPVPENQRLVITTFSGQVSLPTGQALNEVALGTISPNSGSEPIFHEFVPTHVNSPGSERFTFVQDAVIFVDATDFPGDGQVLIVGNDGTGSAQALIAVTGYLIDCSAGPCN
jgi:hypothetical protein